MGATNTLWVPCRIEKSTHTKVCAKIAMEINGFLQCQMKQNVHSFMDSDNEHVSNIFARPKKKKKKKKKKRKKDAL